MNKSGYTLVELMLCGTTLGIIILFLVGGVFLVKGCNHVLDKGVKDTVEQLWTGEEATK